MSPRCLVRNGSLSGCAVPVIATFLALGAPPGVEAQDQGPQRPWDAREILRQETYVTPPEAIAEAVLAPRYRNVTLSNLSPDKRWFLEEIGDGPITMDLFSRPFHDLGGEFIDVAANRSRSLLNRSNAAIRLTSATDGSTVQVQIPDGARVSNATWSPDGSRLAFFAHSPDATHLYVAEPASGRARRITTTPVLATLCTDFDWSADGRRIATVLIPGDRPPMPVEPERPTGPRVKRTEDAENRLRTFASLLATPYDQQLLEWHATGQVAFIDVEDGTVTPVGQPTMVRDLDLSPDGEYVRVTSAVKPFSYIVPVDDFGTVQEVWEASGRSLVILQADSLDTGTRDPDQPPPQPGPFGRGREAGRRELAWREDGSGLTFLELEPVPEEGAEGPSEERGRPEGQGRQQHRKDRVMQWIAPFDSASLTVIYESETRLSSHRFSPDHEILFLSEREGETTHEYAVYLGEPEAKHTLARYDPDDLYADPGSLVMTRGVPADRRSSAYSRRGEGGSQGGATVLLSESGEHVFYTGTHHDKNPLEVGPRSFVDRVTIRTGEKERIYESDNEGVYERVAAVLDMDARRFVVSRESPSQVPQSFLREGDTLIQLTRNVDYTPDITLAPRERLMVERPDGLTFLVSVALPPGYQRGTRLPALFWIYPREYTDQGDYDESWQTHNRNAFPDFGTRSKDYLVRLGYAVVEPDMPIVGAQGRMNDNYVHDLRNDLAAVIDELDRRQMIDRARLGVGGRSYGSFSVANALAHTPYFKAGIAGYGNFNRTFTPITFQSERRILWEARETYLSMSPFLYANNITGALLIYHGMYDQNDGTDPDNAPRMFHALNGLGKTAALYLYPFEDHTPAARETLLDLWARWTAWLEVYVKNAGQGGGTTGSSGHP